MRRPPAGAGAGARVVQRRPRIVGRFVPGWQQAEDAGRNAGDRDREHQDDPVDADVVEPREVLRQDQPSAR